MKMKPSRLAEVVALLEAGDSHARVGNKFLEADHPKPTQVQRAQAHALLSISFRLEALIHMLMYEEESES